MKWVIALIIAALLLGHAYATTLSQHRTLPHPSRTPGALNPAVTQHTLSTTICHSGYTSTIRPPSSYTTDLKRRQLRGWYHRSDIYNFEEDHFQPLELGGSPKSVLNLWPEPWPQAHTTDKKENALRRAVCDGDITLRAAQREMARYKYSHG